MQIFEYVTNFIKMQDGFWNLSFLGNAMHEYMVAFLIFILLTMVFYVLQKVILTKLNKLAKKTKTDLDDAIIETLGSVRPSFYWLISLYISLKLLIFPDIIHRVLDALILIVIIFQLLSVSSTFINYLFKKLKNKKKDNSSKYAYDYLSKMVKVALYAMGLLLVLSNLGINVTSLIAGLGIGGIAIAFALQNILSDLFSSFAIWFDKPFIIGDFIVVGPNSGNVEKIGIKSTRLRSLQGEEIVISNKELTSARIQNFRRLTERRVVFDMSVEYGTDKNHLLEIPLIMQKITQDIGNVRFGRTHFKSFGDSALVFEVVYFVESDDYDLYMDVQQQINLAIYETFKDKGIKIAFPSQTVYLAKE